MQLPLRPRPARPPLVLLAIAFSAVFGCIADRVQVGTSDQALTEAAAPPDLDGIKLDDDVCDCAAAFLKNLQQKLIEAQKLYDAAKASVSETQGYLTTLGDDITAERAALNEVIASDISLYTGIALDAAALALDVSVPSSALVRRTACNAAKKATNVYVKKVLTTIVKRTTIVSPTRSALRRIAVARVIEGQNNGITEAMTWIPVVGPVVEMMQKFQGLRKRDELMALRKDNLVSLVAEYDSKDALLKQLMQDAENYQAEIANLNSKIDSFNASQALCEAFADDPGALGELGIDPEWPPGWADVFFIAVPPKPVVCEEAWIKFTGSSRLSRFWGSRDAINAARAHAESMCFSNPVGATPNPTCEAPRTQQRSAFFDFPGGQNPSGDRHGAGCGEPRLFGSSTVWSDPLTEIDCWCFRRTCCGQGLDAAPVPVAAVADAQVVAVPVAVP
jgi:hypothetical protein